MWPFRRSIRRELDYLHRRLTGAYGVLTSFGRLIEELETNLDRVDQAAGDRLLKLEARVSDIDRRTVEVEHGRFALIETPCLACGLLMPFRERAEHKSKCPRRELIGPEPEADVWRYQVKAFLSEYVRRTGVVPCAIGGCFYMQKTTTIDFARSENGEWVEYTVQLVDRQCKRTDPLHFQDRSNGPWRTLAEVGGAPC